MVFVESCNQVIGQGLVNCAEEDLGEDLHEKADGDHDHGVLLKLIRQSVE